MNANTKAYPGAKPEGARCQSVGVPLLFQDRLRVPAARSKRRRRQSPDSVLIGSRVQREPRLVRVPGASPQPIRCPKPRLSCTLGDETRYSGIDAFTQAIFTSNGRNPNQCDLPLDGSDGHD